MELESQKEAYRKQGLNIAAVTYDSPEILKHFAERKGIGLPLLADRGSEVIRAFGILNENVAKDSPTYGIPFPGTYLLDARGRVRAKYFEQDYRDRYTSASILMREFPATAGRGIGTETETRHLKLRTWVSNQRAAPGARVTLALEVVLPEKMHVYAPGVDGYIPVDWKMPDSKQWVALEAQYPPSKRLELKAIQEVVPVFEGTARITRDIVLGQPNELGEAAKAGRLEVEGTFRYQACDDKVCYTPQSVPVKWTVEIEPFDRERVPAPLRKVGG